MWVLILAKACEKVPSDLRLGGGHKEFHHLLTPFLSVFAKLTF